MATMTAPVAAAFVAWQDQEHRVTDLLTPGSNATAEDIQAAGNEADRLWEAYHQARKDARN